MSTDIQLSEQESIVKLISDKYARRIIDSIQSHPKSAVQISKEIGIELSSIYRRLHKFEKHNLLKITFQITSDGKKSFYYQSKINAVIARYHNGKFDVDLDFN